MGCLADPQVHDFVAGRLEGDSLAEVDAHLDRCASCRELVGGVRRALSGDGAEPSDSMSLPAGARIGRFEIDAVLGRGAMGVVYAARDPRLERPVALKLLRADRDADDRQDAPSSLLAEAKAMAQVAHPNVVAVYDVDAVPESDTDLYVAMELVDGETLRAFIETGPHGWRQVLELMLGAGRGLATAHRAGVLHRDFKPENVLIGVDRRARVTDFGLARACAVGDPRAPVELVRTQTSIAGTPAYMAPELFGGAPGSPSSDQFSFCVTLFETLTGGRPFAGEDLDSVLAEARAGRHRWPADRPVPAAVRRVVARGLAADPADRWPTMDALLDGLASAGSRRRSRWMLAAASTGLIVVAGSLLAFRSGAPAEEPCAAVTGPIDEVWNPTRGTALAKQFERAGVGDAYRLAGAALDRYARDWSAMRVDACEATHVRREQSPELLDLRMLCLDRRLSELRATADQLASAGAPVLADAPRIVGGLAGVGECADVAALRALVPPPASAAGRERLASLQGELDRALAADAAGDAAGAKTLAERVVAEARALDYGPLLAEALQVSAASLIDLGELDGAEAALNEALTVASKARDHQRVANISVARVYFVGARKQQLEAALALTSAAEAAVAQAGGDPGMAASLHMNVGVVYDLAGKRAEAERELTEALRLFRQRGADTPREGDVLHNLGALAMDRGDYPGSRAWFEQALALRRRVLGAQHPAVADTLVGLGAIARREQHNADARAYYDQAAAIYRAVYGDEHAQLGAVYNNLAIIGEVEGRLDQALTDHQRALEIRRATYGEEHPLIAQSLNGIGNTLSAQGKHAEALTHYQESLALRRTVYPAGHPGIAIGLHGLAGALSATGDIAGAVAARQEALDFLEQAEVDPLDLAEIRFAHAEDLWTVGNRREAIALARRARTSYAAGGQPAAAKLARVRAWLAAHPR